MNDHYFDQDKIEAFGQPWHGSLAGTTLTIAPGVTKTIVVPATRPDTHLVEFPGLPVPDTVPAETAENMALRNYALLYNDQRQWSPMSGVKLGIDKHAYLTPDMTQYRIRFYYSSPASSGSINEGTSLQFLVSIFAIDAAGAETVLISASPVSITGFSGAGYYGPLTTFSPDGKRLCITIHKYATLFDRLQNDARRSLGVGCIYEVVLSGGSNAAAPTAVLSQIKDTAACNLVTNTGPAEYVADIGYSVTGTGEGTATPLPSPPNPAGLVTLSIWNDWTINLDMVAYFASRIDYRVVGAAYSAANALCIFALEEAITTSITDEYSGPADGATIRLDAEVEAYASDHSIVTNVLSQTSIPVRVYVTGASTSTYRLKSDTTTLYQVVKTVDWTGVGGNGYGKDGYLEMFLTHSPPLYLWQSIGGEPVYTFDGETVTGFPAVSARMTSNNTAAMFCDAEAYSIVSVAAIIGDRQTLPLDGDGLPWCAWNPKSGALAVTPGHSWC